MSSPTEQAPKSFAIDMGQGFYELNMDIMRRAKQLGLSAVSAGSVMRFIGEQPPEAAPSEPPTLEVDRNQLVLW